MAAAALLPLLLLPVALGEPAVMGAVVTVAALRPVRGSVLVLLFGGRSGGAVAAKCNGGIAGECAAPLTPPLALATGRGAATPPPLSPAVGALLLLLVVVTTGSAGVGDTRVVATAAMASLMQVRNAGGGMHAVDEDSKPSPNTRQPLPTTPLTAPIAPTALVVGADEVEPGIGVADDGADVLFSDAAPLSTAGYTTAKRSAMVSLETPCNAHNIDVEQLHATVHVVHTQQPQ